MNIIFIDLDGVLANFDAYYFQKYKTFVYEEFRDEVLNNKLYTRLPPMFNMSRFVTRVVSLAMKHHYNVEILSSTHTLNQSQLIESTLQKREWLDKNGLSNYKLNAVRKRSEKGDYAKEGNIIIDDQVECVEYFKERGGKGIVYQGPDKTIEDLIAVLNGKDVEIPKNLKNQF
jgi:hypothetical protein